MRRFGLLLVLPLACGGRTDVGGADRDGTGSRATAGTSGLVLAAGGAFPNEPTESGGAFATTGGTPASSEGSGGSRWLGEPPSSILYEATARPWGRTHQQWLGAFWQWFLSLPRTDHPREGGDCAQGQRGSVWFLTTGHHGAPETRTCTIPAGTSLFIPATSTLQFPLPDCSSCLPSRDNPDAWQDTLPDLVARSIEDLAEERITFELDGELLPVGLDYLWNSDDPFSVLPPEVDPYFTCTGPIGANACGWEVGKPRPISAVGFAVMLAPLPPGKHVLRFGAKASTWSWETDVTYLLDVIP